MNLSILGPQGSGKGTQAEKIAEKFGLLHIEIGKILREWAASDRPKAEEIRQKINQGVLVSDEILSGVLTKVIEGGPTTAGVVFDGTPRNLQQYELIKNLLAERGAKLDKVIYLEISEPESIKRLSSRRTCQKCGEVFNLITNPPLTSNKCDKCGGDLVQREDDTPGAIAQRLAIFHQATTPVIEQARKEGILTEIDGERPIEEIFEDIMAKL